MHPLEPPASLIPPRTDARTDVGPIRRTKERRSRRRCRDRTHSRLSATGVRSGRALGDDGRRIADPGYPSRHGRAISNVFGRATRRASRGSHSRESRVEPWWQNRWYIGVLLAPPRGESCRERWRRESEWNGENGGSFRLGWAWLTPLALLEKLPSATNGRAGRLSIGGCAHTRAPNAPRNRENAARLCVGRARIAARAHTRAHTRRAG